MQFQRLNSMGETVGKPTEKPTSRIDNGGTRQVGVLYGHAGGGKVYNYLAGSSVRAGDTITPEVTHPKSGKTYKTLAKVVSTRDALGSPAGDTAGYLSGQGIMLKTVGPTDQQSLPGFQSRKAQDPSFTTKKWAQEAKQNYDNGVMQRLNPMGDPVKGGKT